MIGCAHFSLSKTNASRPGRAPSRYRPSTGNARYTWIGEVAPAEARSLIARSNLLVRSSAMEGGANVLGEAIASGTPPIASRIPACVAALGPDDPGLFPVHDTGALASVLARAESDAAFYDDLVATSAARRHLFAPSAEREAWERVLAELAPPG